MQSRAIRLRIVAGCRNAASGFSIQYSTLYLTSRFDGGPPKDEPLNQLVPLVEFRFDSPRGQTTAATMNPGFAYVAVWWQVAAEAIVPLNRAGGTGPGFRMQLLLFLDDMLPSLFGKPLLSNKPERSQSRGDRHSTDFAWSVDCAI